MIYERVLMLESVLCRYKGYCLYKYLEGRQGASAKRANGDFPCRAWKIVIGPFNHPGRIWQNSAGHVSPLSSTAAFHRFPPVPHSAAICGNLGQFACADYLTEETSYITFYILFLASQEG